MASKKDRKTAKNNPAFTFVDLFAGIGGFHAALATLGGECVYASEWDADAASIYELNWGIKPAGDITLEANDEVMKVPAHDVLVGGFPCQPFSKSGKQKGMEETRGTLFWNIAKIIEIRKPSIVLLENVRNLTGPRHTHEWEVIIKTLRDLGYRVSEDPMILSPSTIHPNYGGRPQSRERVFISATRIPEGIVNDKKNVPVPNLEPAKKDWNPQKWNLAKHLPLEKLTTKASKEKVALNPIETNWIQAWDEFVILLNANNIGKPFPAFPIWTDDWALPQKLQIPMGTPDWKSDILVKNSELYANNKKILDTWLKKWNGLSEFPPSRRKLEWQAQDTPNLWSTIMHFRPSGIRAKKPTYVPALVAITQTSIIGSLKRRITIREGARLQGLPDWFTFGDQKDSKTYKQLGNGVNIGAVYNVIRAQVERDKDLLLGRPKILKTVLGAPNNPDALLPTLKHAGVLPIIVNPVMASKSKIKKPTFDRK